MNEVPKWVWYSVSAIVIITLIIILSGRGKKNKAITQVNALINRPEQNSALKQAIKNEVQEDMKDVFDLLNNWQKSIQSANAAATTATS